REAPGRSYSIRARVPGSWAARCTARAKGRRKRSARGCRVRERFLRQGGTMSVIQRATQRLGIMGEVFEFRRRQKLWWMMPMVAVLFLFGVLLILGQATGLAPFIYTLF